MADNATMQSATLATLPAGLLVGLRSVTYSGDAGAMIAPACLVTVTGSDDAKTATDVTTANPLPVAITPQTTGGDSDYHVVAAATTNAANIKASAGQLYGVHVFGNPSTAYPVYVKFHNTAGTPTAGTGVVLTVGVQAGMSRDVIFPNGFAFATGIGITIVKGITDADGTSVAVSDCVCDVDYK